MEMTDQEMMEALLKKGYKIEPPLPVMVKEIFIVDKLNHCFVVRKYSNGGVSFEIDDHDAWATIALSPQEFTNFKAILSQI